MIFLPLFLATPSLALANLCLDIFKHDYTNARLSLSAQEHIFDGDLVFHPRLGLTQIKGGLHTVDGLYKFLKARPDIRKEDRLSTEDGGWAHLVQGNSTVLYLRLPENAYTGKSLKSLWQADLNASGGYLWKTLFPQWMTKTDIFKAIKQVLKSPQSTEDRGWAIVLRGRVNVMSGWALPLQRNARLPMLVPIEITVVVSKKTNEVISAYPSFHQSNEVYKEVTAIGKLAIINRDFLLSKYSDMSEASFHRLSKRIQILKLTMLSENPQIRFVWEQLDSESKLDLIRSVLVPSVPGRRSSVVLADLRLSHSQFNKNRFQTGDLVEMAGKTLELVFTNQKFSANEKAKIAQEVIDGLFVDVSTLAFDLFWTKTVINQIIRHEAQFTKDDFKSLLLRFSRSPSFWIIFLRTHKPVSQDGDAELAFLMTMTSWSRSFFAMDGFGVKPEEQLQLDNIEKIYRAYAESWISETQVLQKILPRLNDAHDGSIKIKLVVDFINTQLLLPLLLIKKNHIMQDFLNEFTSTDALRSYQWNWARQDVLVMLKVLQDQGVQFDATRVLIQLDQFMLSGTGMSDQFMARHTVPILLLKKVGESFILDLSDYEVNYLPNQNTAEAPE